MHASPRNDDAFRILVVSPCFPPAWSWGGQVQALWSMCRGLVRAGASVRVVTTDADLERRIAVPRERTEEGMDVTTVPVVRAGGRAAIRYGLAPSLATAVWLSSREADLCVLQGIWTFPMAVGSRISSRRRVPYVICAHGTLEAISLSEKAAKKGLYLRLIEHRAIARAAAVQFSSDEERSRSAAAIGETPALVHPNAIDFAAPMPRQGEALRRRLGLSVETILAGISGRIHPRKGFDVIVPALARCSDRIHLVSFGADEAGYRARIEALAAGAGVAGRVHFLGQLQGEELHGAYAAVDLAVLPSHGESFGNTALEALAQGTPVLLSDRVPLRGYITRHGLGRVVPSLEPSEWAQALDRWVSGNDVFDRAEAARRVRSDFDVESCGRRLLAEYRGFSGLRPGEPVRVTP